MRTLHSQKTRFLLLTTFCALGAIMIIALPAFRTSATSQKSGKNKFLNHYDIRIMGGRELAKLLDSRRELLPKAQSRMQSQRGAADELRARIPDAEVRLSPLTGSAEMVATKTGSFDSTRFAARFRDC